MKKLQKLSKKINDLTMKIEEEYPELYQHLDETPVTIPNLEHPKMDTKSFSDYLESLQELLKHRIEEHKKG